MKLNVIGGSAKTVIDNTDFGGVRMSEITIVVGVILAVYAIIYMAIDYKNKNNFK
jgi:hypothetical protein